MPNKAADYPLAQSAIGLIPEFINIETESSDPNSSMVISSPWPSSPLLIWGLEATISKYITHGDNNFRLFDGGSIEGKLLKISGRIDDILIIQGKNYSSTVIEDRAISTDKRIHEAVAFTQIDVFGNALLCLGISFRELLEANVMASIALECKDNY